MSVTDTKDATARIQALELDELRDDDYDVVLAGLFHLAVSLGFFMLKDVLADLRLMALNGLVWIGIAAFIVLLRKQDLLWAS